jgi:hypothetical protein
LVHRIESLLDRDFVHNFRITRREDLDQSFRDLLREAYSVGNQESPGMRESVRLPRGPRPSRASRTQR